MHYFNFNYGVGGGGMAGIFLLMIWALFWKGLALWHASKRNDKTWFIVILVLNTVGILDIVYLFAIVKVKFNKLW